MLRMHKLGLWFFLLALPMLGWWWLHRPDVLTIKTVKFVGQYRYLSEASLIETALPFVQDGFFNIATTNLREKLCHIPWVADASITRVWPDTLVIKIDEHIPIARWGNRAIVDEHGDLIIPKSKVRLPALPVFHGPSDRINEMVNKYHTIATQLEPLGLYVKDLSLSERHSWSLVLDNQVQVLLGREDTYERLNRFAKTYPVVVKENDLKEVKKVDLRYANGLAVTWQPVTL